MKEMAAVDRLPPVWRDLVNEYGWVVVRDMRLDGHRDADRLRELLVSWRERRQQDWLSEIPYGKHQA